jgi:CheY-like chemotaxis protein
LLKEWGLRAHAVASAEAARGFLAHAPAPAGAVVGCMLGDGDGLEMAGEWRKQYGREFPVIMLGPLGQRNQRERAASLALDYLPKPLKHLQLREMLVAHLSPSTSSPGLTPAGEGEPSTTSTFNLRLLLAEDNTVNQRVARLLLRRFGCEADVAANGLEVLQALQRKNYDVILLDIHMPEMDGLEAARHLRASLSPAVKPYLIALTASATLGDHSACRAAGIEDYLTKPLHAKDLEGALRRAQEWLAVRAGTAI